MPLPGTEGTPLTLQGIFDRRTGWSGAWGRSRRLTTLELAESPIPLPSGSGTSHPGEVGAQDALALVRGGAAELAQGCRGC